MRQASPTNDSTSPGPGSFPARARLLLALPADLTLSPLVEDAVLQATRRLHQGIDPLETPPTKSMLDPQDRQRALATAELARQHARLRRLLGLDASSVNAQAVSGDPNPAGADPRKTEAHELLERARAFHEEWRQLLLDDSSPDAVLREFAASPYLDLLERHHDLLWLLLDREGCLLRAGRSERAPAPLEPGLWLEPEFVGANQVLLRRSGWESAAPWLGLELAGGLFLVAPSP